MRYLDMSQNELNSNNSWIFLNSKDCKLFNDFFFVLVTTNSLEMIAIQKIPTLHVCPRPNF